MFGSNSFPYVRFKYVRTCRVIDVTYAPVYIMKPIFDVGELVECLSGGMSRATTIGIASITQYTHVRNNNDNILGSSSHSAVKVIFHTIKELLLKEGINTVVSL